MTHSRLELGSIKDWVCISITWKVCGGIIVYVCRKLVVYNNKQSEVYRCVSLQVTSVGLPCASCKPLKWMVLLSLSCTAEALALVHNRCGICDHSLWSGNENRYGMRSLFYDQEIAAGVGYDCCFMFRKLQQVWDMWSLFMIRKWQQIWDVITVLWSGKIAAGVGYDCCFMFRKLQQVWDMWSLFYVQEMICLEAGCTVRTTTIAHSGWVQHVRTGLGYIEICRNN